MARGLWTHMIHLWSYQGIVILFMRPNTSIMWFGELVDMCRKIDPYSANRAVNEKDNVIVRLKNTIRDLQNNNDNNNGSNDRRFEATKQLCR